MLAPEDANRVIALFKRMLPSDLSALAPFFFYVWNGYSAVLSSPAQVQRLQGQSHDSSSHRGVFG
jgi:hypothetical protein